MAVGSCTLLGSLRHLPLVDEWKRAARFLTLCCENRPPPYACLRPLVGEGSSNLGAERALK